MGNVTTCSAIINHKQCDEFTAQNDPPVMIMLMVLKERMHEKVKAHTMIHLSSIDLLLLKEETMLTDAAETL